MSKSAAVECRQLSRVYQQGSESLTVLHDLDFQLQRGTRVAIVGASGSGKSTLLHLLGGLDQASSGDITLAGRSLALMNQRAIGRLRNRELGFIYQFHHLLGEFTALENVCMPLLIGGESTRRARERGLELLRKVGLGDRIHHKPGQLSGGERQRVAVARALINRPTLVLADEPTGNLDHHTAEQVFDLMLELNRASGTSLLMVTHDISLAQRMDRVMELVDGRLTG
ncbi:MAG TPA: lipoprotein-releasing ABC transporter ATP-binding protein LolD [Chromatiaceae bacterium]|nr:lipoprotein-releasing ABC transporter ATP-binding protein LolD [Chromatiaceae bacterium]HIB83730.1 lipoprotein-releasing ABC transporter ATP-binding protein LolD [Chromatiaceae bacterium]HIN81870.1 lipoprotein-releasing ABC transporter ATP-binding protein LolD [Chromatiales bacterium]HIO14058.1 lipoprotein-releasing ABC transporter ATP-binding protein LolD [Chromatiales bacterium]HIO54228.1 lipoprotein-releasing ABC transporter ATP-binding protein LolD [Chromatiales bacterium]